jgi:hypothetical protein
MFYLKVYHKDSEEILKFNSKIELYKIKKFLELSQRKLCKEVSSYQFERFINQKGYQ